MLMLALMGRKNRGIGKYQDYLPSLPVPPLKATLQKYIFKYILIIIIVCDYSCPVVYSLSWFLHIIILNVLLRVSFYRYLDSVRPLLAAEEYKDTQAVSLCIFL